MKVSTLMQNRVKKINAWETVKLGMKEPSLNQRLWPEYVYLRKGNKVSNNVRR